MARAMAHLAVNAHPWTIGIHMIVACLSSSTLILSLFSGCGVAIFRGLVTAATSPNGFLQTLLERTLLVLQLKREAMASVIAYLLPLRQSQTQSEGPELGANTLHS